MGSHGQCFPVRGFFFANKVISGEGRRCELGTLACEKPTDRDALSVATRFLAVQSEVLYSEPDLRMSPPQE